MFGFLAHTFPSHVALTVHQVPSFDVTFSMRDLFLELAKAVHSVVLLLPPSIVTEVEREEQQWVPDCECVLCVCVFVCVCVYVCVCVCVCVLCVCVCVCALCVCACACACVCVCVCFDMTSLRCIA